MNDSDPLPARLARMLADRGAPAVALVGSRARGEAAAESDVDLAVLAEGPRYRLEVHERTLVSLGWAPAAEQRGRLYDPEYLCTHVEGWRSAVLLHDPQGLAAEVQREARAWSWDTAVEARCDAWAAERVTCFAEEVHKLVASLRRARHDVAAVQRSLLAVHMAYPVALRRRLLYPSENALRSFVGDVAGAEWRAAQAAALGLGGEDAAEAAHAALALYRLAAAEVEPVSDDRQRAVVELALAQVA